MFNQRLAGQVAQKYWYILLMFALIMIAIGANTASIYAQKPVDVMIVNPEKVWWNVHGENGFILRISGPDNIVIEQEIAAGVVPTFTGLTSNGDQYPDGLYSYELWAQPAPARRLAAVQTRGIDETAVQPSAEVLSSGYFTINNGLFITRSNGENSVNTINTPADQVILDDLIVDGSFCVGFDCVNGEAFGFDTQILKENNLRIYFNDTSVSASFPRNDWRITINDSANGGASYFGIDDATANRRVFSLRAGAPSNALVVDSNGDVGLGTNTPVLDMHIVSGDTPGVRLDQRGGGWTPQIWDIAGNEANFFIRDVTHGNTLPFRIIPNAPENSIYVNSDGRVGLGTNSPTGELDVPITSGNVVVGASNASIKAETTGANAKLLLNRTDGAMGVFVSSSNGFVFGTATDHKVMLLTNNSLHTTFNTDGSISTATGATLTAGGVWTDNSDRNLKMNIIQANGQDVLQRLANLPISTWSYKVEGTDVMHMGPMAQDFYATFGLGNDENHIAALDTNGVALVAVQELYALTQEQNAQIEMLTRQNEDLQARVEKLEIMLNKLLITETPVIPVPK